MVGRDRDRHDPPALVGAHHEEEPAEAVHDRSGAVDAVAMRLDRGGAVVQHADVDVIGNFTQALLAEVRQFDRGPQNLRPGINLDDRAEDRFYHIEGMPRSDG